MDTQKLPEVGQRVECLDMKDIGLHPVPPGTHGTVRRVEHWGAGPLHANVHVNWDNGSTLALLTDVDKWRTVEAEKGNL